MCMLSSETLECRFQLKWSDMVMVAQPKQAGPIGGDDHPDKPAAVERTEPVARPVFTVSFFAAFALFVCMVCFCLGEWLLAPQLAICGVLFWHTRHDPNATLPGFIIGFVIGVITSAGTAAIGCGFFAGTVGVPMNAICRGFWRSGATALVAMVAYWVTVQILISFL
jgi:hypothetical protein